MYTLTEVLSVRVKKSLKDEAEKLGVDLKVAVEQLLEDLVAEKKAKAQNVAKELSSLMDVKADEWVDCLFRGKFLYPSLRDFKACHLCQYLCQSAVDVDDRAEFGCVWPVVWPDSCG